MLDILCIAFQSYELIGYVSIIQFFVWPSSLHLEENTKSKNINKITKWNPSKNQKQDFGFHQKLFYNSIKSSSYKLLKHNG